MANSTSRMRSPDSFLTNQPTLSRKVWKGSLQHLISVWLTFPNTQQPSLSPHSRSPQLQPAWDSCSSSAHSSTALSSRDLSTKHCTILGSCEYGGSRHTAAGTLWKCH
uniref:Uncharacterized protein n=1 Tax=Xenopus tropicalis TaxID=8364 RepID=A0A6I8RLN0_XENTR